MCSFYVWHSVSINAGSNRYVLMVKPFLLALIDKIYHAQKERDTAVNARLKLAKDEKEDLLARMRRLEKEQAG